MNVALSLLFFFLSVQNYFSNALITDQVKTKKIPTVLLQEVWIPDLNTPYSKMAAVSDELGRVA